jgi:hypothetical protein
MELITFYNRGFCVRVLCVVHKAETISKNIFVKLSNPVDQKRRILENSRKKLLKNLGFQKG